MVVRKHENQPAMLLAWRRVDLDGSWWGLLAWMEVQQLPFGDPEYEMVHRWTLSSQFDPLDNQDYSRVPRLPPQPVEPAPPPYPQPRRNRLD